ncbi:hypothetical protein ACVWXN_006188 [Bradyrhizobium sp. i1.4.4]
MLALDHAAGDVVGHGFDDHCGVVRFGEHDAAEAGVLDEAVHPLVAPHHDVCDDIDPESGRIALADAAIEQVDLVGHLREQGIERVIEDLQPRHLRVAQIDDHTGPVGGLDPCAQQRVAQPHRARLAGMGPAGLRL